MSAFIVFISAGEREMRLKCPLIVCCDEQVAEAVKEEAWQEILRLERILREQGMDDCNLGLHNGQMAVDHLGPAGTVVPVMGHLASPRMDGFSWWIPEREGRGNGGAGRVEITIVEVESVGPIT